MGHDEETKPMEKNIYEHPFGKITAERFQYFGKDMGIQAQKVFRSPVMGTKELLASYHSSNSRSEE